MNERMIDWIIACIWTIFLFGLWFIWSLFQGTEGQWWSFWTLNMEKPSGFALEISFIRICIAFILSLLLASFITKVGKREKSE